MRRKGKNHFTPIEDDEVAPNTKNNTKPSWTRFFTRKEGKGPSKISTKLSSKERSVSRMKQASETKRNTIITLVDKTSAPEVQVCDADLAQEFRREHTQQHEPPEDSEVVPVLSKRKTDRAAKAKAILSRPFLRGGLPPKKGRDWVVEVSPAEWDGDQNRWKYRILVQRRQLVERPPDNGLFTAVDTASSFTTAFTWRSIADFAWLEEALLAEFHGALILPLLSIAIGSPDIANTQYEVDATLLRDWFSDVLNGIRGQGELALDQSSVDIISSEALEAFLYRNTDPLPIVSSPQHLKNQSLLPTMSTLDLPWKGSPEKEHREASFVSSLWSKPFSQCSPFEAICPTGLSMDDPELPKKSAMGQIPIDLMRANCSSRAMEDSGSLEMQDSFVQYEPGEMNASNLSIQSQLMEAERELVEIRRKSCLTAMERLRLLKEEESLVAGAWKRVAISFSNLYSYEKEVENSRVGEKIENTANMPYRKLSKTQVDELLRVMARQKLDRSNISLAVVDAMLRAYVGDLSAVGPAVNAYSTATTQLSNLEDAPQQTTQLKEENPMWEGTMKAIFSMVEMKKGNSVQTVATSSSSEGEVMSQRRAFEIRVLRNERLLRESLTTICKALPIRAARIAYKFLNCEISQATLLSAAAIALRNNVNLKEKKDLLDSIRVRHQEESEIDDSAEISLVQRLIDLGRSKKCEADSDIMKEAETEELCEKAIRLTHARAGKWDAELALAIMEAVGIDDAEVQVEETTRDLRLVRRHAIGLRENLSRCMEALAILRSAILYGHHDEMDSPPLSTQSIREGRRTFFHRCSIVFSGTFDDSVTKDKRKSALPSIGILSSVGIPMDDPAGWLPTTRKNSKVQCGNTTLAYIDSRDADIENFLNQVDGLMKDYKKRVECIESYVYMQCVGIQLEKHFSKKRADALAAFEKKTDIQTAINIAQRKRLPRLVQELDAKMEAVAAGVTHTTVKEAKEAHLLSKTLKGEIGDVALRRFQRTKESAMDNIVALMTLWANYEEVTTGKELRLLNKAVEEVEKSLRYIDISSDGISHMVESKKRASSGAHLAEA